MIFVIFPVELPPRTRRIHATEVLTAVIFGTTSAYAENTQHTSVLLSCMRNYLRVRGEYCFIIIFAFLLRELPPRTRRIPLAAAKPVGAAGTTSAYAENTAWGTIAGEAQRNYLRVRGEYKPRAWAWAPWRELPPRTRRIQDQGRARAQTCGTTSAYAENT